ncbi:unnamed protein product [Mesocestoides corti]|uniref:MARVEL domain-containing protein n=1 Tax=Mesocestoides corti TaxID=53468 RepID=A0A0R3U9V5_MESCO|nr:unnamed protein product [Mesocestoides corti]
MAVSCNTVCLRISLVVYSIIITIIGIACAGVGIYLLLKSQDTTGLLPFSSFILVVVAGVLVLIVGFLGFFGALKQSTCLLRSFGIGASILLVIELAATIFVLVSQTKGCAQALHAVLENYTWAIGISVIVLCLIEIGAIVSACRLARKQTEDVE